MLLTDNEPPSESEPKDRKLLVKFMCLLLDILQNLDVPSRQPWGHVPLKTINTLLSRPRTSQQIYSYLPPLLFPIVVNVGLIYRVWWSVAGDIFVEELGASLC